METTEKQVSNREVKSSAFTTLFSNPENAAQLYAALDGAEETKPEDIRFTTLSGVLFMARKNDMAFTAKNKVLVISEHQSTINYNMPLRDAIYYGRTVEKLIEPKALYQTKQIDIPTPEFYVFYNGDREYPEEEILKLSDAYLEKSEKPMLELKVKVININFLKGHPVLAKCQPLYEYSWFIEKIKEGLRIGLDRDEAIISAMNACRENKMLEGFLAEHGTEAVNMIFTEFNMEDALDVRYEEGLEDGRNEGRSQGELRKLVTLVLRKIAKGNTSAEAAEALEEPEEVVAKIYAAAARFAPNYDVEMIVDELTDNGMSVGR